MKKKFYKKPLFWFSGCFSFSFIFFLMIILSIVSIITLTEAKSQSSVGGFELSENVLIFQTKIKEELSENNASENYTNYILAMIDILTKGEGEDILKVQQFVPGSGEILSSNQSIEIGVKYFTELLVKVSLPLIFDEGEPDETKMKRLLQAYVLGIDFLDYLGEKPYSQTEAESYASSKGLDDVNTYFADDVYLTKNVFIDSSVDRKSFLYPVPGHQAQYYITAYWGDGRNHKGIDIGAKMGTPIIASRPGTVVMATYHYSWGNYVKIKHDDTYHTLSAHMTRFVVSKGDVVEQGQIIGYIGSTGQSTGPHLHFEIYKNGTRVDPYPYIEYAIT